MSDRDSKQDNQDSFEVEKVHLVFKETRDLIHALEGSAASHVIIKVDAFQIEIERASGTIVSGTMPTGVVKNAPPTNPTFTPGILPIVAPLVGVFYRSPSPGTKPFIEVGDTVEPGQKVCVIEAMKVMNEVTSDHRGIVTEILVKDGEAVQYEQHLILIDTIGGIA